MRAAQRAERTIRHARHGRQDDRRCKRIRTQSHRYKFLYLVQKLTRIDATNVFENVIVRDAESFQSDQVTRGRESEDVFSV